LTPDCWNGSPSAIQGVQEERGRFRGVRRDRAAQIRRRHRLDGSLCAVAGEADGRDIVLDVADLVCEPLNYDASDEL
jgi:hypothetical protein